MTITELKLLFQEYGEEDNLEQGALEQLLFILNKIEKADAQEIATVHIPMIDLMVNSGNEGVKKSLTFFLTTQKITQRIKELARGSLAQISMN